MFVPRLKDRGGDCCTRFSACILPMPSSDHCTKPVVHLSCARAIAWSVTVLATVQSCSYACLSMLRSSKLAANMTRQRPDTAGSGPDAGPAQYGASALDPGLLLRCPRQRCLPRPALAACRATRRASLPVDELPAAAASLAASSCTAVSCAAASHVPGKRSAAQRQDSDRRRSGRQWRGGLRWAGSKGQRTSSGDRPAGARRRRLLCREGPAHPGAHALSRFASQLA